MEKIWTKLYDVGVPETIDLKTLEPIPILFENIAKRHPNHTAFWYFGRRIRYRELERDIVRFSHALKRLGIRRGDRVLLHLPNVPQFVIAYFATLRIGAVVVPVNPTYRGDDLEHILESSGSKLIITLTKFFHDVEKASRVTDTPAQIIVVNVKDYLPRLKKVLFTFFREKKEGHQSPKNGSYASFANLMKRAGTKPVPYHGGGVGSIALLQYTGGTTGRPKGVLLTQRNIIANTFQMKSWMPDFKEGGEVIAAVLPFFHIYGLTAILHNALLSGSAIVLFPEPDLPELVRLVKKHRITIMPGVPLLFERLLNFTPQIEKATFAALKFCVSGAAPLREEVEKQFEERTGAKLVQGYGLTETSGVTHVNPLHGKRKKGSIGLPVPNTFARVVNDETGEDLGPREVGELLVAGPQVMRGYWKDRNATKKIKRAGWLYTGDMAYYDEEGYFFLVDRKKDMIYLKGSGLKIYPSEVEDVIAKHPFVREVVVVGIDDGEGGEVPAAYIVPNIDYTSEEALLEEIREYCEKHLTSYKVPRTMFFVQELPKTILGKPLRRLLREKASQNNDV